LPAADGNVARGGNGIRNPLTRDFTRKVTYMSNSSIDMLYERLVSSSFPIEPVMQRQIFEHCLRLKKFKTLGRFAARTDLSDEIEALLAKRREALVLAGWASRPGLTSKQLLERLASDTRVSTLLPLAGLPGLPQEVYGSIAARDSVKLTTVLMANPSVDASTMMANISSIVRALEGTKYPHEVESMLANWKTKDDTLLREILVRSNKPAVILEALWAAKEPPHDWVESCMSRIDAIIAADSAVQDHYLKRSSSIIEELACTDLAPEHLKKLRSITNALIAKTEKDESLSHYARTYLSAKTMLSSKGRALFADALRLKECTDLKESVRLFKKILPGSLRGSIYNRRTPGVEEAFMAASFNAVSYNKVLPVDLLAPYLELMQDKWSENRLMCNWISRGELSAVAAHAAEEWNTPEWLAALPDPLAVLQATVKHVLDRKEPIPGWVLTHSLVLDSPDTALSLLPWKWLSSIATHIWSEIDQASAQTKADVLLNKAQAFIVSRLKEDPQKWETFSKLAEDYDGTLPDLLVVVESI